MAHKIREVYIVHHSHTDVGYTDLQEQVIYNQANNIRRAVELIEEGLEKGTNQKDLKWNCETWYCVEQFLKAATKEEKKTFFDLVKKNSIGLSANYLNFNDLADCEYLTEKIHDMQEVCAKEGITVKTAMFADINGISMGQRDAMLANGVEFLYTNIHTHHGMYPLYQNQEPYFWENEDGKRLLVWSGEHYNLGNALGIVFNKNVNFMTENYFGKAQGDVAGPLEKLHSNLIASMEEYEENGYPYDFYITSVSGVFSDNAPINPAIADTVALFNEKYSEEVTLRMVTLQELYDLIRNKVADAPVYRGAINDWWGNGVGSTAEGGIQLMEKGRFGIHGGQYIPETLMNEIIHLEEQYEFYKNDPEFCAELDDLLKNYAGRPSLLYYAEKMTKDLGGAKIYLKREDLNHTGSHKINNVLGQVLMAKKMGKTRVIAETGAGQHGVACATAAALLGLECEIFMGKEDTDRQALNVYRMKLLGAKVHPVTSGTQTLKDAVNETMREWTNRVSDTHYVLGSVMGPHPFPTIVRDFQSVIGREAKAQIMEKEGKLPAAVLACVGGGSNAMGMFYEFIPEKKVALIGCEAAGKGIDTDKHAATMAKGTPGVFHGMKSYFCQDQYGQIAPVYSISAGLDYPGIGPEHAWLHDTGRASYVPVTDEEAVEAFEYLARTEGIICAIESAHAVAHARKLAPTLSSDQSIIICLSGRGDKDVAAIARYRGEDISE